MALISPVEQAEYYPGVKLWAWEDVTENDTLAPLNIAGLGDKSVHIFGDFGGGTINILGSNEFGESPTSLLVLNDYQGNPLSSIAADKIEAIQENVFKLVPSVPDGTSVSLTIIVLAR